MSIDFLAFKNKKISDEIDIFNNSLSAYELSFENLIDLSPSNEEKRILLIKTAFKCCENLFILKHIETKGFIPVKKVISFTLVSKNIILNNKLYLTALVLLFSNPNLTHLQTFIKNEVGDLSD